MRTLFILFTLLIGRISFSQQIKNPVCLTDSCRQKFLKNTVYYGSFPLQCVKINFKSPKGGKWSEVVYVVSIHNYYQSGDGNKKPKEIDSIYTLIYNDEYLVKDTTVNKMFGGYILNEQVYTQMKAMPFEKFLYTYFDREGNLVPQYNHIAAEVLAVCFSYNITFLFAEYLYPAIHDATWDQLCLYYPKLKNLKRPPIARYSH